MVRFTVKGCADVGAINHYNRIMLYLALLLASAMIALIFLQRYALRKHRGGFSLRDGKQRRRKRSFLDPDEERMRQWLESEDDEPQ